MTPDPADPREAEGVLNPACARSSAGKLVLFPRVVAAGNFSRIGRATVTFDEAGRPTGVQRDGYALEPAEPYERNPVTAGVEDPRITTIPALGLHVMTYTGFGPDGPRIAVAVSRDLENWQRLGLVRFADTGLGVDLNRYDNKDAVLFPEPVPGPDGRLCIAMLHRPCFDLPGQTVAQGAPLPAGVTDSRPGIWISYVPLDQVQGNSAGLVNVSGHRPVAFPEFAWESLKIGAGTPPVRVPQGWLLLHHGVSGRIVPGVAQQQGVNYAAGAMILDAADPSRVTQRTPQPLLSPATADERSGIVPNVVFPTAIDVRSASEADVYYGMADSKIGVARLTLGRP